MWSNARFSSINTKTFWILFALIKREYTPTEPRASASVPDVLPPGSLYRKITRSYLLYFLFVAHPRAMKKALLICCASLAFAGQADWQKRMLEANRLDRDGRYSEAQDLYVASLDEAEKSGATGRWFAESLNNLAAHYFLCGNYSQAEPLYRRAL